jgi:hypothetical protein
MAKKMDFSSGPLEGWEAIDSPRKDLDSAATPFQQPDRVAQEFVKVARKYAADNAGSTNESLEHSTLIRAKKKGSLDSDVNSKTFVLSGSKVIGSQG